MNVPRAGSSASGAHSLLERRCSGRTRSTTQVLDEAAANRVRNDDKMMGMVRVRDKPIEYEIASNRGKESAVNLKVR
jgi:hypothetical protein